MWTEITRPKYERTGQRYASDLTDREWAVIEPLMPAPKRLGRPRETDLRGAGCDPVYCAQRMPVAYAAEGLAKQLGSVSQACRIMGFSRDSFYRFKELYEKDGEAALIEMSRRVPNPKNRVAETVERRILELAVEQPAWGHTRMANELAKEGFRVSTTGVRGVWVRHEIP